MKIVIHVEGGPAEIDLTIRYRQDADSSKCTAHSKALKNSGEDLQPTADSIALRYQSDMVNKFMEAPLWARIKYVFTRGMQ